MVAERNTHIIYCRNTSRNGLHVECIVWVLPHTEYHDDGMLWDHAHSTIGETISSFVSQTVQKSSKSSLLHDQHGIADKVNNKTGPVEQ